MCINMWPDITLAKSRIPKLKGLTKKDTISIKNKKGIKKMLAFCTNFK